MTSELNRRDAAKLLGGGALWATQPLAAHAQTAAPITARAPILVLNSLDATVSVIDAQTFGEVRRVDVGKEPHHLYLTPDEKSVIVANAGGNSLSFFDPRTAGLQRTINNIPDPYHLRFTPDMKWFVAAANRLHRVDIYSWDGASDTPLKLQKRIEAPRTPSHINTDSKSTVAYVTLQDSNELAAIDLATQSMRWKVRVGKMPADIFTTRDDKHVLIGLTAERHVEVYDVSGAQPQLVKRINSGKGAHAFRSRGDGKQLFVSNRVANTISIIDLATFSKVGELPAPGGPDCMDLLKDGNTLLVTSRWAKKLTMIDVDKKEVLRQIDVGRSPHGVWTLDHAPRH
jgi:YVTN family beta-propeller protein